MGLEDEVSQKTSILFMQSYYKGVYVAPVLQSTARRTEMRAEASSLPSCIEPDYVYRVSQVRTRILL